MRLLFALLLLANAAWPAARSSRCAPCPPRRRSRARAPPSSSWPSQNTRTARSATSPRKWNGVFPIRPWRSSFPPRAWRHRRMATSRSPRCSPATRPNRPSESKMRRSRNRSRFRREILGILTKRGCNSAICHGGVKGQGGFKLSANALYPADDYEWITKGGGYQVLTAEVKGERIPRIDLANPEKSLLLLKPTMGVPHGGGKRFETDSEDYQTILGWIRDGAPYSSGNAAAEAKLARLELYPPMAILPVEARASPAGDRALQRRPHGRLHAPGALHGERRRSRRGQRGRRGQRQTARRNRHSGARGRPGGQRRGRRHRPADCQTTRKSRATTSSTSTFSRSCASSRSFRPTWPSDSEFLRRVCLDLTGTLPPPAARARIPGQQRSAKAREGDRRADRIARVRRLLDLPLRRSLPRLHFRQRPVSQVDGRNTGSGFATTSRATARTTRWRASASPRKATSRRRATSCRTTRSELRPTPWPKRFASSWGAASIARSATTIPTKTGARISSGAWPPSSRACSAWARWWWTIPTNMDLGTQRCGRQHGAAASAHQGGGETGAARRLAARTSRAEAIRARSSRAG